MRDRRGRRPLRAARGVTMLQSQDKLLAWSLIEKYRCGKLRTLIPPDAIASALMEGPDG